MNIDLKDAVRELQKNFVKLFSTKKSKLEQMDRDIAIYQKRETIAPVEAPLIALSLLDDILSTIESSRKSPYIPPDLTDPGTYETDLEAQLGDGDDIIL